MTGPDRSWRDAHGADPADMVVDVASDAAFAQAALEAPGAVLRFVSGSSSDLARALGLGSAAPTESVVTCDLLDLEFDGVSHDTAANAVVLGVAPDRLGRRHRRHSVLVEVDGRQISLEHATTVVVANGQFLRGHDLVPRGHPGDGRCEVQVYGLAAGERGPMRARLAGGSHLPHPRIAQAQGRAVRVRWARGARPVDADGLTRRAAIDVCVQVRPGAARVLI